MTRYLKELESAGLNLLIYRDGEVVFSSAGGGIRPLLDAVDVIGREGLRGSIVVDKIVGRAAALLTVYMGAAEVHAALISAGAKTVLRRSGIRFHFHRETPAIRSRDGAGLCPFERIVQGISDAEEAYRKIRARVSEV